VLILRRRRWGSFLKKSSGVVIAVIGITLFVKTLPVFFWTMLAGLLLIWLGWQMYIGSEF